MKPRIAKFAIGQVVKHRNILPGIVYDVDPVFANTEECGSPIPVEVRPRKDTPFYPLFAETPTPNMSPIIEQNLMADTRRSHAPSASRRMFVRALVAPIKSKRALQLNIYRRRVLEFEGDQAAPQSGGLELARMSLRDCTARAKGMDGTISP